MSKKAAARIKVLEERLACEQNTVSELQAEAQNLKLQNFQLELKVVREQTIVSELQSENVALKNEAADLEYWVAAFDTDITRLQVDNFEKDRSIRSLKGHVGFLCIENQRHKATIDNLTNGGESTTPRGPI